MSLKNCKRIDLPKIGDERGMLSFAQTQQHVPFIIQRIFYMYDIPEQQSRGAHAHKTLHQFIISMSGGFAVELDDGREKEHYVLDKPWHGLYVAPMTWTTVEKFQRGSVCLVLASDVYDEADYYRNYDDFLQAIKR